MPTSRLDHIVTHGTPRNALGRPLHDPHIVCADGFRLSVLAPDDECLLPAQHLEIGFPTQRPEPWSRWREFLEIGTDEDDDPTECIYLNVPVALVRELVLNHGGEMPRPPHHNERTSLTHQAPLTSHHADGSICPPEHKHTTSGKPLHPECDGRAYSQAVCTRGGWQLKDRGKGYVNERRHQHLTSHGERNTHPPKALRDLLRLDIP